MKHVTHTQDRRDFLKTIALLAGGVSLAPALRVLPALAASAPTATFEERMLMGTVVGITVVTPSKAQAQDAIGRAFAEMERLIGIFNRFDAKTALATLNAAGRLTGAPRELLEVVAHSRDAHRLSGGRFDITVAPIVNLLQRTQGRPDPRELRAALALVNTDRIEQRGAELKFGAGGMAITLDGIAKGYIADCAAGSLKQSGVGHFLINAGGDIRLQGSPQGTQRPWRIAIEDPDKRGKYPSVIELRSGAVATSGGYEVYFDPARKSHHLVNPESGGSPQYIKSVSVQAPTAMQADSLATALSLMAPRQALQLIASLPGHSCLLITSTGARLASPNWGSSSALI